MSSSYIVTFTTTILIIIIINSFFQNVSSINNIINTIKSQSAILKIKHQIEKRQRKHSPHPHRPFLTLSYAQTIDGMIGRRRSTASSNLKISGDESLAMTHAIRSIHDAVLIGKRTMMLDNPRLNVRLWKLKNKKRQPIPVILDTHLECLQNSSDETKKMNAKGVIVCCSHEAAVRYMKESKERTTASLSSLTTTSSSSSLEKVTILPCRTKINNEDGGKITLDLSNVLHELYHRKGIRSVMVEGGSAILSSFITGGGGDDGNDRDGESMMGGGGCLVDCICVTIAPKIMGGGLGLNAFEGVDGNNKGGRKTTTMIDVGEVDFVRLGKDCVLIGSISSS